LPTVDVSAHARSLRSDSTFWQLPIMAVNQLWNPRTYSEGRDFFNSGSLPQKKSAISQEKRAAEYPVARTHDLVGKRLLQSGGAGDPISSDHYFHFLSCQEDVRKTNLTFLFDITQEFIVMVGIMMRDNKLLNLCFFRHF
jgi:hypothetical protein